MKTAWAHLPNAKQIDFVISQVKANYRTWGVARYAAREVAWEPAWDAAWDAAWGAGAARDAAWEAAWVPARDAAREAAGEPAWVLARDAARYAARHAILALIAYDHCGSYLDLPVGQIRMLAVLGDNAAILLLPASTAIHTKYIE